MNNPKSSASRTVKTRNKIGRILAAVAVVICLFLMAPAQNSPTPDSNAASAAASPAGSPTPIPFSELITQADQTNSTLKKIVAGAASDPTADAIESDLPPLSDEINARFVETADAISGPTSLEDRRRSFLTPRRPFRRARGAPTG